jgi:hypothetical protein
MGLIRTVTIMPKHGLCQWPGMQPASALNVRDCVIRVKRWWEHGADTASG